MERLAKDIVKYVPTIFLQAVIVALGVGALGLMLWMPHLEGRNVDATTFEIYFKDPFLAYAYTGSIAFFVALYQAFRLLGYVRQSEAFSAKSAKAVRIVKYCALVLVAFIVGAEAWLIVFQRRVEEDIAGGVMMGLLLLLGSLVVAASASVLEQILRSASRPIINE